MSNVGYGTLQIIPSAKGFKALLDKEVSAPMKGVGDKEGKSAGTKFRSGLLGSLKGIAGPIAALVAGTAVIGFFKDAVNGASDLSESTSKVGVVFKTSAAQIVNASRTSASGMGLSQQAYLEATGTLGNLLVSLDLAPKKAADMSQQMVKLAGDLASFNNVSPEETLDALRAGLTGEAEPLKKFGINMNASTLAAQALKMGLIKNVKEALTPQNKALAAQALIMAQTKTAQGDFARTSGGLANQQRILSAQFLDVKAKVGGALLPIITTLVTFFNSKVIPIFSAVAGGVTAFASAFANAGDGVTSSGFAGFMEKLAITVRPVFDTLVGGIRAFASAFTHADDGVTSSGFAGTMERIAIVARGMVDTFISKVIPALVNIGKKIVSNVVPGVISLVKAIAPLVESAIRLGVSIGQKVLPFIIQLAGVIGGTILTSFKAVAGFVSDNATLFQSLAVAVGAGLAVWKAFQLALATGSLIMKGISAVTKAFAVAQGILNAVMALNPILIVVIAIAALAAGLIYAYKHSEKFRAIVDGAFTAVKNAATAAWNWIQANWPKLLEIVTAPITAAQALISKAWDILKKGANAVWTAVSTAFKSVVKFFADLPGKIATALGNAVTWLVQKGKDFLTGLKNGIVNGAVAVWTWFQNLSLVIHNKIGNVASALAQKGKDLLSGLKNGIVNGATAIWSYFKNLPGNVVRNLGNLGSTLASAGKDMARGFINGIGDMVGKAADKAKELANAAKNAVKNVLGINSPSKVLTEIGVFTGQGFANGMKKSTGLVTAASQGMANAAVRGASLPIRSASASGIASSHRTQIESARQVLINVNGANDPEATARIVGRKLADQGV